MREIGEFQPAILESLWEFERERFIEIEGDTIYFCDPVYGDRLQPEETPPSLLEDEIFCKGIAALQHLTQEGVSINIAFNYHRGEEDFERLQEDATWLECCKVVGLEWGSAVESPMPRHDRDIEFDVLTSKKNGRYVRLTKDWLESADVSTVPSDINTHMTMPDETIAPRFGQGRLRDRLVQAWLPNLKVYEKQAADQQVTAEDWAEHYLAWSIYQHMRQYLLLAHFGYMVSKYEDRLRPGDMIGLAIGSGHLVGVTQKMEWMGIPLASYIVVRKNNDDAINEIMNNKVMPYGKVTQPDLYKLAEHGLQNGGY